MKILKWIRLILRLVKAVIKLTMKMIVVFTVLAMVFGIHASLYMTFILMILIALIFVRNLFEVIFEGQPCRGKDKNFKRVKPYDFYEDDYWVPGMPAVTPKAYEQGFFHGYDD